MEAYNEDFSISRNDDGSDFSINQNDNEKSRNEPTKKPKQQKPDGKTLKKGVPGKTSGTHQEGTYDKQSDKPAMRPGSTDEDR